MIGRTLSHYRIIDELGAGGMGVVYVAEDNNLKRRVALKILPSEVAADLNRLDRFRREARALAALNHPHIVTIYSIEEADGIHFITMELIEGKTLDSIIPQDGMALDDFLKIAHPLCDAVAAAHQEGIIHRDLKPANLMIDKKGKLKVLDFGLAKFHEPPAGTNSESLATVSRTESQVVIGTVPFMSPEQVQGQSVDSRTDIYSIGVILYRMATGKLPFTGNSAAETVSAILRDTPASVMELRLDFPVSISQIIESCLQKNPDRRFQKTFEISNELEGTQKNTLPTLKELDRKSIKAIAVLPLNNLSGLAEEDYFADGMTDTLITDLAKACPIRVISRTSIMQYKGTKKPLSQISKELGVDAVVEGSIFRAGDRVRITAQLIRTATDDHLWAERYDRKLEDILGLQDDVVRAIIKEINATLNFAVETHRRIIRKIDPEVYLLVMRGRQGIDKRTESGFRQALDLFKKAIEQDPTYAPSYSGLADSMSMLANYGYVPPGEIVAKSLAAVEKALELDEGSADAHRVLAFIHWQFLFAWRKAIAEYERALELDPNSALTNYFYGVFLGVIGFFRKSEVRLKRAAEKDPLSPLIPSVQGWILYFERRFNDAIPYFHRVLTIEPNYYLAHWFLGESLIELGEFEEGINSLEKALQLSGRSSRLLGYTGYAYGRAGRADEARRILEELEKRELDRYVPPYFLALVHSGLGDAKNALDRLDQAYAIKDTMLRDLKADAQWDHFHDEPRFHELMRLMDYPDPELNN